MKRNDENVGIALARSVLDMLLGFPRHRLRNHLNFQGTHTYFLLLDLLANASCSFERNIRLD